MSRKSGSDAGLRWSGWPCENHTAPAARIAVGLGRRDRVRQAPAPEVGRALDPRIGGQHRLPVVDDAPWRCRWSRSPGRSAGPRQHSRVCARRSSGHARTSECRAATGRERLVRHSPPLRPPEEANRELLVPLVRPGAQPHLGRRPLRPPLTMPAPTRTLTVADVHRFVDEQVFRPTGDRRCRRRVRSASSSSGSPSPTTATSCTPAALRALLPDLPGREPDHVRTRRSARAERCPGVGPRRRRRGDARRHRAPCATRSAAAGIDLVGAGIDTRGDGARVLHEPRYTAMEEYFDTVRGRPAAR